MRLKNDQSVFDFKYRRRCLFYLLGKAKMKTIIFILSLAVVVLVAVNFGLRGRIKDLERDKNLILTTYADAIINSPLTEREKEIIKGDDKR